MKTDIVVYGILITFAVAILIGGGILIHSLILFSSQSEQYFAKCNEQLAPQTKVSLPDADIVGYVNRSTVFSGFDNCYYIIDWHTDEGIKHDTVRLNKLETMAKPE